MGGVRVLTMVLTQVLTKVLAHINVCHNTPRASPPSRCREKCGGGVCHSDIYLPPPLSVHRRVKEQHSLDIIVTFQNVC